MKATSTAATTDESLLSAEALAGICRALGHPARIAIVEHLARQEGCLCRELVDLLPLAQSTVSEHLRQLKACGLIRGEVQGPRTCYCLDREVLNRFRLKVASLGGDPKP